MLSCPAVASVPFQMFPASITLHVSTIPLLHVSVNFPKVMTWVLAEVNGNRSHAQRPGDGDREFRGEQRRRHPRHLAAGIVGEREWRHAASGASHCALACWEPADDCHQHAAGLERDAVHLPELV